MELCKPGAIPCRLLGFSLRPSFGAPASIHAPHFTTSFAAARHLATAAGLRLVGGAARTDRSCASCGGVSPPAAVSSSTSVAAMYPADREPHRRKSRLCSDQSLVVNANSGLPSHRSDTFSKPAAVSSRPHRKSKPASSKTASSNCSGSPGSPNQPFFG
eukprot:SAG31_NODE_488_length_14964_cov_56.443458_12_plen_159_part_00